MFTKELFAIMLFFETSNCCKPDKLCFCECSKVDQNVVPFVVSHLLTDLFIASMDFALHSILWINNI